MLAGIFIAALILGIFVYDAVAFWWRENAWKRRWNEKREDD
jgi:hypothetical protein